MQESSRWAAGRTPKKARRKRLVFDTYRQRTHPTCWRWFMVKKSLWVELNAKPGKEKELEEFLKSAQPLAEREKDTVSWYALKMGPANFGIFDTFADDAGRQAHLNGEIAKALMSKGKELLANDPKIHQVEIIAAKTGTSASRAGA
jgi:quinol monooxygenase YgiN